MPGDELKVQVVRSGKVLELAYTLQQSRPLVPALHGVECVPSYFIVAGLVFVPLSIPFLEHAYGSKLCTLSPFLHNHSRWPCSIFGLMHGPMTVKRLLEAISTHKKGWKRKLALGVWKKVLL